jgi:branched-chain amino acid transport system substrate-binding protein
MHKGGGHVPNNHSTGATDSEIRIGQTMPYSGALSAYSALGKAEIAYFNLVNERGGINGRKIKLISVDDGYVPPRMVEQTRRLVESDEVALIFSSLGTAQNNAIAKYLQAKNVPQLFLASGASNFGDISRFPKALMGIQAPFRIEARLYARHAVEKLKATKIAVLAQNDDFGRDYLAGLRDVLESRFEQVVSVATYEIDSQVVRLKSSGADVFLIAAWRSLKWRANSLLSLGNSLLPRNISLLV